MFPPTVCMLTIFGTLPILAFQNGRQPIKSTLFDLGVCMLTIFGTLPILAFQNGRQPIKSTLFDLGGQNDGELGH